MTAVSENEKKNINYTRNDGAKYRYSASPEKRSSSGQSGTASEKVKKTVEALTKRAEFWKTNRAIAIVILVAVILLFSVLSCYRAVAARARQVEKYYSAEIEPALTRMLDEANRLASYCEAKYKDIDTTELRRVSSALKSVQDKPYWSAEMAYDVIREAQVLNFASNEDAKDIYDAAESCYNELSTSLNYKSAAEKYNKAASRFPTKIFSRGEAPIFKSVSVAVSEEDDTGVIDNVISGIREKISDLSGFQIFIVIVASISLISYVVSKAKNK